MPDLRAAAARIRDLAAGLVYGFRAPWRAVYGDSESRDCVACCSTCAPDSPDACDACWIIETGAESCATYLAVLGEPLVARAVADLLDALRDDADSLAEHDGFDPAVTIPGYAQACALAELIGGA
jgi:hypothetical protein